MQLLRKRVIFFVGYKKKKISGAGSASEERYFGT